MCTSTASLLSCHGARQLYRPYSLQLPRHTVKAAKVRDMIKGILAQRCSEDRYLKRRTSQENAKSAQCAFHSFSRRADRHVECVDQHEDATRPGRSANQHAAMNPLPTPTRHKVSAETRQGALVLTVRSRLAQRNPLTWPHLTIFKVPSLKDSGHLGCDAVSLG
jgi:hypothetical protein